ncbi:hypothetical protein BU24DRAFT_81698 [Aaosphaeria arxii CBS 175.79]|uniref:L domain-like protein n=1 Tax=Aaosphaeria arxii CBS 175.79 TaxID=1450172 RepID=A0A6A5XAG3_9PLEO|nr:uncharacterized protein BU24DRAFT_81698 [Aaosphaeria arxii CBS 175.79]KAF2009767.1 hypothetical protein BU24DRAFT_81698 [Aaosphaeria arxii CBS 175.79]
MDPPSSLPVRTSGIPRPTSRLPVLNRSSTTQSQLRQPTSTEQLRKKPSLSSISRPTTSQAQPPLQLQKKPSRSSLARPNPPATVTTSRAPSFTPASSTSTYRVSSTASTSSRRVSSIATSKRPTLGNVPARSASTASSSGFSKTFARPPSRQTQVTPKPRELGGNGSTNDDDVLGDLDGFRSASRASSRAGFHEQENEVFLESDAEPASPVANAPLQKKSRPSLSERTIESLSMLPPSSPAASKGRRRSSFFNSENPMGPPSRPASALGGNRRPGTSDGTPRAVPATPRQTAIGASRGSMTAPGKRSVSAAAPSNMATPSKVPAASRISTQFRTKTLAPTQNSLSTPRPRPLSNSKTMTARTPKTRPSLGGIFGEAVSPPASLAPSTPSTSRQSLLSVKTPETSRRLSNSPVALRDETLKSKVARKSEGTAAVAKPPESSRKAQSSSSALREQIAKAKEEARRAHVAKEFGNGTPPREVPAVTENDYGIEPDPAEIAEFDFGLDDPFNQHSKGSKSLLRKRIDAARVEGRLNIAALGLNEIPDEVLGMYKYDPNDNSVAWGEVVDVTTIIAADNALESLPQDMFPDVDFNALDDSDEASPQFGGVQSLDLHGNVLLQLPSGLGRLTYLSKLNLSRNKLPNEAMDVISQISSLRELKLADNEMEGQLLPSLGNLRLLETLELQENKLTALPEELRELENLRSLNVSQNRLKSLPADLFTSVPIVELLASKNAFSGHFFNVESVPHLQSLRLSNNALTSLCESGTVLLPALKHLDVSTNRLSSLPDMSSWSELTTLLMSENKVTAIPTGFTSLQQLRNADFTGNDITKLDEKIALMSGLENLTLSANPLRERKFLTMSAEDIKRDLLSRIEPSTDDAEILNGALESEAEDANENDWQLTPSGTLDLSAKCMTEIDEEAVLSFAETNAIRQLYLQQNQLTTMPNVLSQLTHLTLLDLSKNNIVDPCSSPISLPKLRELRFGGNRLKSLDGLLEMVTTPALQNLDVSNNQIAGPLPTLRSTFPELLVFMASDNAITDVSAESLEGLKIVNLSNNSMPRLEPRIGLLAGTLTSLDVEGNTFRVPNYAVLKKGTDAVLAWLRDKVPSPTDEFFGGSAETSF